MAITPNTKLLFHMSNLHHLRLMSFALTFLMIINVISCRQSTIPDPDEIPDDEETEVLLTEDEAKATREAAFDPNKINYRFQAGSTCDGGKASKVYYKSIDPFFISLPPNSISDSLRRKQTGTWKSFSIKPTQANKILVKKLDKTLKYHFYIHSDTDKKMYLVQNVNANPTEFKGTETQIFTNSIIAVFNCLQ